MNQSRFSDDKSADNMSMLTSFDLGALEEMDPSLSKLLFQNFINILELSNLSRWRI